MNGSNADNPTSVDSDSPPNWAWWLGPAAIAIAFLAVITLAVAVGVVVGAAELSRLTDDYPQVAGIAQDALWIAVALGVPLVVYGALRATDVGLGRLPIRRAAVVTALGLAVFYAFAAAYSAVAGLDEQSNDRLQESVLGTSIGSDLAYVSLYVVLAPLAEELLFRGLLFGSLRGRIGVWPAALASGAVFGVIHLGGGQDPFIPVLAALGVVLALAYHYSGVLYAAIAIHAVNNAVSTGASQDPAASWIYAVLAVGPLIAVGAAMILGYAIDRWAPSRPRRERRERPVQQNLAEE